MKSFSLTDPNIPEILIVDDMPANLKILSSILEGEGYMIRPVTNGQLALQVAAKEKPDLIILDIMMPVMDGYEVCRRLKENPEFHDIPVIFISALNDTKDIVKALRSGGVDYITKPFQAEEVTARVNTHLKLHFQNKELKKQTAELQKLNNEKDMFFSIVSHDLRSPFSGFLGLTRMLVNELPEMTIKEIQPIVLALRNSASKVNILLDDLLEWVKIQRGIIACDPIVGELLPVVHESLEIIMESAITKKIDITVEIQEGMLVFADRYMLQTVIRNLVSNAVKFTKCGGKITLSASCPGDKMVEISVRDTGIGMNWELIDGLFHLDVITGRRGTAGEPSTGLGLVISKELIERQGGGLFVESDIGKGSRFWFTVPREKH